MKGGDTWEAEVDCRKCWKARVAGSFTNKGTAELEVFGRGFPINPIFTEAAVGGSGVSGSLDVLVAEGEHYEGTAGPGLIGLDAYRKWVLPVGVFGPKKRGLKKGNSGTSFVTDAEELVGGKPGGFGCAKLGLVISLGRLGTLEKLTPGAGGSVCAQTGWRRVEGPSENWGGGKSANVPNTRITYESEPKGVGGKLTGEVKSRFSRKGEASPAQKNQRQEKKARLQPFGP